ncbi:glycoside hydrolase family 10 protein [Urbifossiella limnaea]|uniref:Glycosyl hydrolase-like 10 domain-containing protein n=1 Tax=Urbifossiella limnaea TaxID=2528023 RepID=A0A517XMN9_9BACT|nr:family 10 glycosylhydrolase [Urbifossiella limnaea]QDU18764.1 hypothetical protein ETAA1_06600 [Urbifossiella limnaea]
MPRLVSAAAVAVLLALPAAATQNAPLPPPLKREFRGVWVATVGNIDWPTKPGLPAAQQKAELIAILDKAAELKLNAVIFQVRPMADSLYRSELEPWSEYLTGQLGTDPGYDPLALAVQEAHARGLELHAWFNPYRARHPTAKSVAPPTHVTKARPDLAPAYGKHHWMNPTNPEVQKRSLDVILDVVKRYDVDGVHIDDYFYPYKEKDAAGKVIPFPDDDTWAAYQKAGGKLARDDWRRDAVNAFVRRMYDGVKTAKPTVQVGISPFGIWRPGHPAGIAGLDQYAELYADARLWLNEGWVDYWTPQLYWPIAQQKQSFPRLLDWWAAENTKKRHLWPGLYTSRVTGADKGWPATEVAEQIGLTRKTGANGAVHFSMKALMKNTGGVADELKRVYAEPALVPETPWAAPKEPLAAPRVVVAGGNMTVTSDPPARFVIVRQETAGGWTTTVTAGGPGATLPRRVGRVLVSVQDQAGRLSPAVEAPRR